MPWRSSDGSGNRGDDFGCNLADEHAALGGLSPDYQTRSPPVECDDLESLIPPLDGFGETRSDGRVEFCSPASDLALLNEPHHDRSWQAQRGLARLTLPQGKIHHVLYGNNDSYLYGIPTVDDRLPQGSPRSKQTDDQLFGDVQELSTTRNLGNKSSSPLFLQSSPSPRTSRRDDDRSKYDSSSRNAQTQPATYSAPRTPIIAGSPLIEISTLPERIQSAFPYRLFNAVQSQCFSHVYHENANFVMSAPTGSGKTVVLEMAICRLLTARPIEAFRILYTAPTRSLCSERSRDWSNKFQPLNLECVEITGDTGGTECIRTIQKADIVVSTPEKWDSVTRKWKDNKSLFQSFKLFLIDEVHMLGEARGATLEVVVSRMRAICSNIRFVAVSATVQNVNDVADWLGNSSRCPSLPAHICQFSEEYRPVKLERHVYPIKGIGSAYQVDEACNKHIPIIIHRHTRQRPILIFCFTKNSCFATANLLKRKRESETRARSWWDRPQQCVQISDPHINELLAEGIAVHHGGLNANDRAIIEAGFLDGSVMLICCTSTLAVGVNLPCHLVIIKNTMSFTDSGPQEYTDVEIMQMIGRAGRPQFTLQGAVAVIMTGEKKADRYQRLVAGQEPLESHLHQNLVEHMNAEILLGTIVDVETAQAWLKGTFLCTRLRQNPAHYCMTKYTVSKNLEEQIAIICHKNTADLVSNSLVSRDGDGSLRCTRFGEAMVRYFVRFTTMRILLDIPQESNVFEILTAITRATELGAIRFRQHDKNLYRNLNTAIGIRFPLEEITTGPHKAFVIVQVELGGVNPPVDVKTHKINYGYLSDRTIVFNNIHRLARCAIDCKIATNDAVGVRNGLELARCLNARVWEESPLQLKQISGIGPVTVRKLSQAGISSIEALEQCDPARINMILGATHKGEKFRQELSSFPRLWIQVSQTGYEGGKADGPTLTFKIQFGFMNRSVPEYHAGRPVYVCIVAQRSDNRLVDFRRMKATKSSESIYLQTELTDVSQHIICYAVCDELVGTLKQAELRPRLPNDLFHSPVVSSTATASCRTSAIAARSSSCAAAHHLCQEEIKTKSDDEWFSLDPVAEADLLATERTIDFGAIETIDLTENCELSRRQPESVSERRRSDGKFECNHHCKDKTTCRHLCCREGLPEPPQTKKNSSNRKSKSEKKVDKSSEAGTKLSGRIENADERRQSSKEVTPIYRNIRESTHRGSCRMEDTQSAESLTKPGQPTVDLEENEWFDADEALCLLDELTGANQEVCTSSDDPSDPTLRRMSRRSSLSLGEASVTDHGSSDYQQECADPPDRTSLPPLQLPLVPTSLEASDRIFESLQSEDGAIASESGDADANTPASQTATSKFGRLAMSISNHEICERGHRQTDVEVCPISAFVMSSGSTIQSSIPWKRMWDGDTSPDQSLEATCTPEAIQGITLERPQKILKNLNGAEMDIFKQLSPYVDFVDED